MNLVVNTSKTWSNKPFTMKSKNRRMHRRSSLTSENSFFKKEGRREHNFFGNPYHEIFFQPSASIQRKCEKCEEGDKKIHRMTDQKDEEKKLQRQPDKKEEEKKLQRKENGSSPYTVTGNDCSSISGGRNLPREVNQFYTSKMGYDFRNVRIHTDADSAKLAQSINAKAFTVGNQIVFGENQYDPTSFEGKKLLAHELVHITQNQNAIQQIKRKVNYVNPKITETDPVTTVLDNPRLALTSPLINGNPLPDDMGKAGVIILEALGKELNLNTVDKKRICSSKEPNIDCGAAISIIKKPTAKVWQGSAAGSRFSGMKNAEKCNDVSSVTVYIKGKSGADAITVYNKVMANEKEHVNDINKAAKTYLEPLVLSVKNFNKQVSNDPAKENGECHSAFFSLAKQPIIDFLKDLRANIALRDKKGGPHDFKPDVIVDGKDCFTVVAKV
jgi:hypothetical protein